MKNKFLLIGIFFLSIISFAQKNSSLIKKADKKYNNYEYIDAIALYEKATEKGTISAETLKKLGDSYYFNSDLKNAGKWYEKLMVADPNVESEYFYRYSLCLKTASNYEKANEYLEKFASLVPNDSRAKRFKAQEDYLERIKKQSDRYTIEDANINSRYYDYGGAFLNDQFVFTTTRDTGSVLKAKHKWTNQAFSDLYSATITPEGLKDPKPFSKNINSKLYESTAVFTKDGNTVYFTRNNYLKGKKKTNSDKVVLLKLYKASYIDNEWKNITELPFNNDQYNIAHPALSADDKTLYFVSDMPGTLGLSDIFKVTINDDGSFGVPENLGSEINTEGRESFPYMSDENELFFSSNGHMGLGGLDIFVIKLKKDNTFTEVYNLGAPLNSQADDFGYIIDNSTKTGYFSSNREGGKGYDDIYKFKETVPLPYNCKQALAGIVVNEQNSTMPNAIVSLFDSNMNPIGELNSDEKGQFLFKELECEKEYYVKTQFGDEFEVAQNKYITGATLGETKVEVVLEKRVKVGTDLAQEFVISSIYFDTDKYNINKAASVELYKLVEIMTQNPKIKIEVRSHTDSRQTVAYNQVLSNKRAKSTVKWLINHGISPSRLIGIGLGESELLSPCADDCSSEEHQKNRRSDFVIIKT